VLINLQPDRAAEKKRATRSRGAPRREHKGIDQATPAPRARDRNRSPGRIWSRRLTGIRAAPQPFRCRPHTRLYTTGKLRRGAISGLVCSRMEIGVPILLLCCRVSCCFGRGCKSAAKGRSGTVDPSLRVAPARPHHARLRRHGLNRVRHLPTSGMRAQFRPHLGSVVAAT